MTVTREELASKVDVIDWLTLRAHLQRGGLVVVDRLLELSEAGVALAADDVKTVERWLLSGVIGKPSAEQITAWDAQQDKVFGCLIVSPYVLIQEVQPEE